MPESRSTAEELAAKVRRAFDDANMPMAEHEEVALDRLAALASEVEQLKAELVAERNRRVLAEARARKTSFAADLIAAEARAERAETALREAEAKLDAHLIGHWHDAIEAAAPSAAALARKILASHQAGKIDRDALAELMRRAGPSLCGAETWTRRRGGVSGA